MDRNQGQGDGGPAQADLFQLDEICFRFDADLRAGKQPLVEDCLGDLAEPQRSTLRQMLEAIEAEFRGQAEADRRAADARRTPSPGEPTVGHATGPQDHAGAAARPEEPRALRITCPHCRNPIEILDDRALADINCPSCGSSFNVVGDEALAYQTAGGTPRRRQKVGRFELLEQLGYGGFGSVWKARDTQLDRMVAVKIPRRGQLDAEETEKFLREARTAAQLVHPNIVSVHEVGLEGDVIYIVSDFIEGVSLADRLAARKLTHREAAALCAKIAEALHFAHERGVVHRDVKPSNVMLDGAGEPHLMDFGLAKREAREITVTVDGQVLGTPAYMSPEQARGEAHAADRRTDVYSLGVVLFELLTGERPFRGNVRMLLKQVTEDDPPRPRQLDAGVPRDLETVCLKCLEKDPGKRYPTAQAMADDLRRFLEGKAIHARPIGRPEKLWRWCKRQPLVASLTAATALSLVVGMAVSAYFAVEASRRAAGEAEERRRAETREQEASLARNAEAAARRQAEEESWRAYQAEARARRWSGRLGQRFESLEAIRKAAAIRVTPELRDEAIAAMALADLREVQPVNVGAPGLRPAGFTASLSHYTLADGRANASVRRADDNAEVLSARGSLPVLSPDGRLLAVWLNGEVQTWDVRTRRLVFAARGAKLQEGAWVFDDQSRQLAVYGDDGSIVVYDTTSGKAQARLPFGAPPRSLSPFDGVSVIRFDPDGERLAVARAHVLEIRSVRSGRKLGESPHPGTCGAAAWHPSGTLLATGSPDGRTYLWDTVADRVFLGTQLPGHTSDVTALAFNRSGDLLATSGRDHTVRLWDPMCDRLLLTVPGLLAGRNPAFGPEHRLVLRDSPDDDRNAALHNARSNYRICRAAAGHECRLLRPPEAIGPIRSLGFSPDGALLAAGDAMTLHLWDVAAGRWIPVSTVIGCHLVGVAIDGSIVTRDASGLSRWPATLEPDGRTLHFGPSTFLVDGSHFGGVAVSSNGRFLEMDSSEGTLTIFDLQTGTTTTRPRDGPTPWGHAISSDGRWSATGRTGSGLNLQETTSGKSFLLQGEGGALVPQFSPDGRWLVAGMADGYRFLETGTWRPDRFFPRTARLGDPSLAFSPDGTMLAVASARDAVQLIDASRNRVLATLQSPVAEAVGTLVFNRQGDRLAMTGEKRVHLWDLRAIRGQLAEMRLDWDLPPFPPPAPASAKPLSVRFDVSQQIADALKAPIWTVLDPLEFSSLGGATLTKLDDKSLLVEGLNPANDTYVIFAETTLKSLYGIRLDVLPHPNLPSGGPGRLPNGEFVLSQVQVFSRPRGVLGSYGDVGLCRAVADSAREGFSVASLLDASEGSGWTVAEAARRTGRGSAIFQIGSGGSAEGTQLVVVLKHFNRLSEGNLGRFRLSIASAQYGVQEVRTTHRVTHYGSFPEAILKRLPGRELGLRSNDVEGRPLDLPAFRGKAVLIAFTAMESPDCQAALASVGKLRQWYRDRGLEVVAIDCTQPRTKLDEALRSRPAPWRTIHDPIRELTDRSLRDEYAVTDLPTLFLVGKDGKIVSTESRGQDLDQRVEQLLGPPFVPRAKPVRLDIASKANRKLVDGPEAAVDLLGELPAGERTFAGVPFRIGDGLLQLAGRQLPDVREGVRGIPVARKLTRLYLLQGAQGQAAAGTAIGQYAVKYGDGSTETIPVVYGEDVRDCGEGDGRQTVARAAAAPVEGNPAVRRAGPTLRLYVRAWDNPHPEKQVATIDFTGAQADCAPFCVAMTLDEPAAVEPKSAPPPAAQAK